MSFLQNLKVRYFTSMNGEKKRLDYDLNPVPGRYQPEDRLDLSPETVKSPLSLSTRIRKKLNYTLYKQLQESESLNNKFKTLQIPNIIILNNFR